LVSTIDDEVESDTEALWFAEAERRLEELAAGESRASRLRMFFVTLAKLSSDEGYLPSGTTGIRLSFHDSLRNTA